MGIWSIYSLTNLYSRGAITEYIANALQMIALCFFLSHVFQCRDEQNQPKPLSTGRVLVVLSFLLSVLSTTHPISGLLSLFLLVPFSVVAIRRLDRGVFYAVVTGILLVAPWVYVFLQFGKYLDVAVEQNGLYYFKDSIDHWTTRLSLWPLDPRLNGLTPTQVAQISTPHLDAQANMSFLILALGVFLLRIKTVVAGFRRSILNRYLGFLGAGVFFLSLYVSVDNGLVNAMPGIFQKQIFMIQFAYRLTSYCSLGIFIFLIGVLRAAGPIELKAQRFVAGIFMITFILSATNLGLKQHGTGDPSREVAFVDLPLGASGGGAIHLPKSFYGAFNYSTPTLFETYRLPVIPAWPVLIPVAGADKFGEPTSFFLDERMALPLGYMLKTNVMAFPWNRLTLEGVEVPTRQFQKVLTVAPRPGRLGFEFKSPAIFKLLRWVGQICFFGVLLWTVLGLVPWANLLRFFISMAGYQPAMRPGFLQTLRAKVFQNSK
jgi:hypothetical protein